MLLRVNIICIYLMYSQMMIHNQVLQKEEEKRKMLKIHILWKMWSERLNDCIAYSIVVYTFSTVVLKYKSITA
jgi:hypothetical protein